MFAHELHKKLASLNLASYNFSLVNVFQYTLKTIQLIINK